MTDRKEHTRAVSPTRQQAVLLSRKSSSEQWTERPVYQRLTVRIFFLKGSECFICMDWLIFKDSHSGKKGLHSVILKMIKPWQGEVKYAACGHKEPLVFTIRCQLILIWSTCFFFCHCMQRAEDIGTENREQPQPQGTSLKFLPNHLFSLNPVVLIFLA